MHRQMETTYGKHLDVQDWIRFLCSGQESLNDDLQTGESHTIH